jgi:hypothetical protein
MNKNLRTEKQIEETFDNILQLVDDSLDAMEEYKDSKNSKQQDLYRLLQFNLNAVRYTIDTAIKVK